MPTNWHGPEEGHVEKSGSCRVTHLHGEQMERGGEGWDSKQVYWRAEGWLVQGRLPALTSPLPHPFIPSVLPAPTSPLGSLMDADSNGCPPSPYTSPPPLRPIPPLSFALPPFSALTLVTSLWKLSSRGPAQSFSGGETSELGCQKHIRDVIRHPSMTTTLCCASLLQANLCMSLKKVKSEFCCVYQYLSHDSKEIRRKDESVWHLG